MARPTGWEIFILNREGKWEKLGNCSTYESGDKRMKRSRFFRDLIYKIVRVEKE